MLRHNDLASSAFENTTNDCSAFPASVVAGRSGLMAWRGSDHLCWQSATGVASTGPVSLSVWRFGPDSVTFRELSRDGAHRGGTPTHIGCIQARRPLESITRARIYPSRPVIAYRAVSPYPEERTTPPRPTNSIR